MKNKYNYLIVKNNKNKMYNNNQKIERKYKKKCKE